MADGILIIDKPSGWTSMDVCAKVRGILHEKHVGHGGTLDPLATGVLPVFAGSATRGVEFAENSRKEYIAGLRLGLVTTTQDISGTVLETSPVHVSQENVESVLARFTGNLEQIPPMYSAVKIKGKKLYELARKGQTIDRPARHITIYELELLERLNDTDFRIRCLCSKGTYIRTLCHDMGQALHCGGIMYELRRTMSAGFRLSDAVTLDDVQAHAPDLLRPVDILFRDCPAIRLSSPAVERRVRSGNAFRMSIPDGLYRVYGLNRDFLCLSRATDGTVKSVKNFFT